MGKQQGNTFENHSNSSGHMTARPFCRRRPRGWWAQRLLCQSPELERGSHRWTLGSDGVRSSLAAALHMLLRADFAIYFRLRTRGPSIPPACAARVRVAGTNAWGVPGHCTLTLMHTSPCRVEFPVRERGCGSACTCVRRGFKGLVSWLVNLPTGAQTCRWRWGQFRVSTGA